MRLAEGILYPSPKMSTKKPEPSVHPADLLDIPDERREAAKATVAAMSVNVRKHTATLPLGADVDEFRGALAAAAPGRGSKWG